MSHVWSAHVNPNALAVDCSEAPQHETIPTETAEHKHYVSTQPTRHPQTLPQWLPDPETKNALLMQ